MHHLQESECPAFIPPSYRVAYTTQACQRAYDWRNAFGYAAISFIPDWLKENGGRFNSTKETSDFLTRLVNEKQVMFKDPFSSKKKASCPYCHMPV